MEQKILESLLIKNFKCFTNLQLRFSALTVLSGYNGTGKSTSFQPLLLYSQALEETGLKSSQQLRDSISKEGGWLWPLNGDLIRLGTGGDVLNMYYKEPEIEFCFGFSDGSYDSYKLVAEKSIGFLKLDIDSIPLNSSNSISELFYISALRKVAEVYPKPDRHNYSNRGVGVDGCYACYLYDKMLEKQEFRSNVEYWMNYIVPGVKVQVQPFLNISLFSLGFKLNETTDYMKPLNVGYGITYAFPIIVALSASNRGDLIIIDSPEAHLHPRAQSRMGYMIAQFAARGIQIVVETHSDHVLNGFRLAVKDNKLKPEDVSILFYSGIKDRSHGVINTSIDKNGNISDWPTGFFDQIDIDTAKLIGFD